MNDFDINAIQLKIQAPGVSIDGDFNDFMLDQISKLGNLFSRIKKCELMLRSESNRKHIMEADIKLFIPGEILYASGQNADLRIAVIEAFHDVHEQLLKYKEKLKDHRPENAEKIAAKETADEDDEFEKELGASNRARLGENGIDK